MSLQLDYILFLYGLSYSLLAWVCFDLHSRNNAALPWKWFGLLMLLQGLCIWSGIFELSFPGLVKHSAKTLNHIFAASACFCAGLFIVSSFMVKGALVKRIFRICAAFFIFYAAADILAVNYGNLYFSIAQVIFSLGILAALWVYDYSSAAMELSGSRKQGMRYFSSVLLAFLAVTAAGYIIVNAIGKDAVRKSGEDLLTRSDTIASLIDPGRIGMLSGESGDSLTDNFKYLKQLLESAQKINRDCRFIYLVGLKQGKAFFYADSTDPADADYSPPGQVFDEASQKLADSFLSGKHFLEGPVRDRWGEWISALSPVADPRTGKIIAVLGMDTDASAWRSRIFAYRLAGVFLSFILMTGLFLFFLLSQSYFAKLASYRISFDAVARQMGDGVAICSPDFAVTYINRAAQMHLGGGELLSKNIADHLYANFSVALPRKSLADQSKPGKIFDIVREETEKFKALYLECRMDMLKAFSGDVTGIVFTLRDVTDERIEELMKQDFLGLISHKLRTPVTVVSMSADMLIKDRPEGSLIPRHREYALSIKKQAGHLSGLLDKLLSFIQASKEKALTDKETIDVCGHIRGVIEPVLQGAKDKKAELTFSCGEKLILPVDKASFDFIFRHLAENSLKFSDKELVKIEVGAREVSQGIEITFRDNGPGIPSEHHKDVFRKFYQHEKFFTGNVEGFGLGLALTKRIIESSGGSIELSSEIDKGTAFIMVFPGSQ